MSVYKITNILVPVDLSESSLNALETAVNVAKKHKASIQILNVEESNLNTLEDINAPYFTNSANSSDVLNALVGAIHHNHGIKPSILNEEGNVADIVIKTSFLQHADLIVMGAHGASGYRDGFIGSNTYAVIKNAWCPVLSVPSKKQITGYRNILFPVRPVTGVLTPYQIVRLFTNPGTTIEVLGLSNRLVDAGSSVLDTLLNEIKDELNNDKVKARNSWTSGISIADDILKYAQETNPDLIVVTPSLDVTSKPKYIGPHAQKIIHCAKFPVLSIKKANIPSLV